MTVEPDIYLHIGVNKTGTSAIQRYFNTHRVELKKHGILYPFIGCQGDAHYGLSRLLGFDHGPTAEVNLKSRPAKIAARDLAKEIELARPAVVVISSENFILPKPLEPIRTFFYHQKLRVVVYLRRHDSWWPSAYNQAVKMVAHPPWKRGFQAFLRFQKIHNLNYGNFRFLLDRWAKVVGKGNLIVRPFEEQQNGAGIVNDFFRSIGRGNLNIDPYWETLRINDSLDYRSMILVDIIQRAKLHSGLKTRLIADVVSQSDRGRPEEWVNPILRRRLVEENLEDYAYIAREFLGREDGRLFFDPLPEPDESWVPPKQLSLIEVVEFIAGAMAGKN